MTLRAIEVIPSDQGLHDPPDACRQLLPSSRPGTSSAPSICLTDRRHQRRFLFHQKRGLLGDMMRMLAGDRALVRRERRGLILSRLWALPADVLLKVLRLPRALPARRWWTLC